MKTFDLEKAKAGHSICTASGEIVPFVAHVPEATPAQRLVVRIGEYVHLLSEQGRFYLTDQASPYDVFMADEGVAR